MAEEPRVSQEAHGSYIAQATDGGTATVHVYATTPSVENQNRQRFLVRLRTRYRDLLAQSLHGAARMTLEMAGHSEAVAPPVQLFHEPDQQSAHPQAPSTSLIQVYTEAGHELLLLGEPGAGKSTLLLELASDLVGMAEQDHSQLLPVIVPLSSWASKQQPLEQWLAEQIALLYDISLPLSRRWVQEERLVLLLDGLDEMEEQARAACIAAINAYHHAHLHPLVVCSRKAEYEAAATHVRLVLHSAVVVQPLTREQVDAYLVQCGEPVAALRTILQENPTLQEIATTPLMLSILILTYQGQVVNDLPATASLSEQQQIFAHYVQRMIARKGKLARSLQKDLLCWLTWLARQMRSRNQTIFYLEHLQPNWLVSTQQRSYGWLAVRLPALLMGMLASLTIESLFVYTDPTYLLQFAALGGLLGWLFSRPAGRRDALPEQSEGHLRPKLRQRITRSIPPGIIIGLIVGLSFGWDLRDGYGLGDWLRDGSIFGAVIGISSFLLSWLLPSRTSPHTIASKNNRATRRWKKLVYLIQTIHGQRAWRMIVLLGAGYGLSGGLSTWLDEGLSFGLLIGLSFGISSVLVSLILSAQTEGIVLVERLQWTYRGLMRSLLTPKHMRGAFQVASVVGSINGLNGVLKPEPNFSLIGGLPVGLSYGLSIGLINKLHVGLISGLSYGLSYGLLYWITTVALFWRDGEARGMVCLKRLAQISVRLQFCSNLL